jgi:sortase A
MRGALRWIERALLLAALACLAWVYATWRDAAVYQQRARGELRETMAAGEGTRGAEPPEVSELIPRDSLVGVLDVPRLGLSVVVREGDEDQALKTAVGHLPDTPLPWHKGNAALAGHRDTFFRPLRNLRVGDAMRLATLHGTFEYRVRRTMVVEPGDLWVLHPAEGVSLTLITCYPFTYVGPAPKRFVVQAERTVVAAPHVGG